MEQIKEKEIVKFLKENIEPLKDKAYGLSYRTSVYLVDGTFLPCVIFRSSKTIVDLAIRRFEEDRTVKNIFKNTKTSYFDLVKVFVASGNRINAYDISKIEKSRFALPLTILKQIHGETRMGWTGFVVKMKDGKCFSYGTTFGTEFFDLPKEYTVEDIDKIINNSYVLKTGEIQSCYSSSTRPTNENKSIVYRERPYFECYLDSI